MKKRVKLQGTRKLDCPANVQIRKVETYTDFAVDSASFGTSNSLRVAKEEKMQKLKATLAEKGEKLNTTVNLLVVFPPIPSRGRSPGGDSDMKWTGMLVVSLRGVNFGFWSRLGCSGQNVIIFRRQGLV